MKVILPSFVVFALGAAVLRAQTAQTPQSEFRLPEQDQPSGAVATADGADLLIQRVAETCNQIESVQARIHFQADLFGQHTIGSGIYLQQGRGGARKFRLDLRIPLGQVGDTSKEQVLVRVCDGQYLWEHRELPDTDASDAQPRSTVTKVDIRRVSQALEQNPKSIAASAEHELMWGGLPKLLDGLQRSFRFTSVQADHLDAPSVSNDGVDSLKVWVATGSWRPEALRSSSPSLANDAAQGRTAIVSKQASQAPDEVALYVGQVDLFPYRIEFRRRAEQGRGGGTEMIPIMQLALFEVRLNAPIDDDQFKYDHNAEDITGNVIKNLGGK
jgi:hypothetical protein